ncbi:MAG: UDP-2,3-diacylglucosamine diphosphatase [Candidatus Hydrogenedentota bacterium]
MSKTLIFADVHLRAGEPARTREFADWLRAFNPAEYTRVVCLGDLFDFWFEYRHVVFSGYFEVLRALAELRDAGVEMHLICGNHDFWAGRFLRDTLGFEIHLEADLPFGGKTVRFIHGDGINPADWKYRIYKRIARNRFVVGCFRQLHPDWAMALAQRVSHGSRTLYKAPDPWAGPEAKALRAYAARVLAEGVVDGVCCGHSHAQTLESLPMPGGEGIFLNPGDWIENRAYATWDGASFQLAGGITTGG